MNYELPDAMLAEAAKAFDSLADNFGKDCELQFPHTRTECPNCVLDSSNDVSSGAYKSGGAQPFPTGTVCPVCTGQGYVSSPQTRTVRMRVYDDPAQWGKPLPAQFPAGTIMTRCKLAEYAAVVSSRKMVIQAEGYRGRTYELLGDPVDPYALGGRWVTAYWKRV